MVGKGLESLIPKKNTGGIQGDASASSSDDIMDDEDRGMLGQREEREGLGVLNSFNISRPVEPSSQSSFALNSPASVEAGSSVSFSPLSEPVPAFPEQPPFDHEEDNEAESSSAQSRSISDIPVISGPIFHIEVDKIEVNPYQPRKEFDQEAIKELASSIREFGILQPLVVTKQESETDYGTKVTYQLIAGHRRLLASKMLGLKTVPAVIRTSLKRTEALEMAIVENIQRRDLNIIETARAYARLSDEFGLTQREIAVRLGKSREAVANALRLLALPTDVQDALSAGKINESHARLLLQIQDPAVQKEVLNDIVTYNLSVRDIKRRMEGKKTGGRPLQVPNMPANVEFKAMEKEISDTLGAPVHVEYSQTGGKIVIHFYSPEEARGIIQKMKKDELY